MRLRTFLVSLVTITIAVALFGARAHAAVWETTAQWDEKAEAGFRQWILTKWNKEYFVQAGPLQGLVLDCADVVYSPRIIYSAENGLPFVMKDPTTRRGTLVSNEMTRWDSKPPETRLRSFLLFIMGIGSTMSVPNDTYPTAITPETLGAGSIILTDPEKHHSWTIQHFSQTGIPYLLFGSRPARTLLYERNEYPSVPFVFPQGVRPETNAGFRNYRQPMDIGKPVHEVPGYSLEQYSFPEKGFMKTVQGRMQKFDELPQQKVVRLMGNVCKGARERVEAVREGVAKNEALGYSTCMTATEYDDFSTPSRDQRLKDSFLELKHAYDEAMANGGLTGNTQKQIESVMSGDASRGQANAYCRIDIAPGKKLTLGQVMSASVNDRLSNNPHDTLEMRWGLERGPSAKAQGCPVY